MTYVICSWHILCKKDVMVNMKVCSQWNNKNSSFPILFDFHFSFFRIRWSVNNLLNVLPLLIVQICVTVCSISSFLEIISISYQVFFCTNGKEWPFHNIFIFDIERTGLDSLLRMLNSFKRINTLKAHVTTNLGMYLRSGCNSRTASPHLWRRFQVR